MRHAERLTDRILFLEGLPNYQRLGTLHIGQTVREQLRADLEVELAVVERLRPGIALMREKGDITSARIFEEILEDEEQHIDYLETELGLIENLGEQLYLARYAEPPSAELIPAPRPVLVGAFRALSGGLTCFRGSDTPGGRVGLVDPRAWSRLLCPAMIAVI